MKEYIADQKIGKTLYKQTKKLYKRYKYGMFVIALIITVMLVSNIKMLQKISIKNVKKCLHFSELSFIILFALLVKHIRDARLAQLAEHLTLNQGVQGSNP